MTEIKVKKWYEDAKMPKRAYKKDVGADAFLYLPDAKRKTTIMPGEVKTFSIGIAVEVPEYHQLIIASKSSIAQKGLLIPNSPIDPGYSGEIFVILINCSKKELELEHGQKIGQLVITKIITPNFTSTSYIKKSPRGNQGFGSTGKN